MPSNYFAPLIVDTGMHPYDLSEISTFNGPILVLSVGQYLLQHEKQIVV